MALNWQRYVIRRRVFDILLKRRWYYRFGASQFSGMNSVCFFGGKNADRILKLLVREIKLSEHVETGRRLQRVRFNDVQLDVIDVVSDRAISASPRKSRPRSWPSAGRFRAALFTFRRLSDISRNPSSALFYRSACLHTFYIMRTL